LKNKIQHIVGSRSEDEDVEMMGQGRGRGRGEGRGERIEFEDPEVITTTHHTPKGSLDPPHIMTGVLG